MSALSRPALTCWPSFPAVPSPPNPQLSAKLMKRDLLPIEGRVTPLDAAWYWGTGYARALWLRSVERRWDFHEVPGLHVGTRLDDFLV